MKAKVLVFFNGKQMHEIKLDFPAGSSWPVPKTGDEWLRKDTGSFVASSWDPDNKAKPAADAHLKLSSRIAWASQHSWGQDPPRNVFEDYTNRWLQILQPGDTVRSLELSGFSNQDSNRPSQKGGDVRLVVTSKSVDLYRPHVDWFTNRPHAQSLRAGQGSTYEDVSKNPKSVTYQNRRGELVTEAAFRVKYGTVIEVPESLKPNHGKAPPRSQLDIPETIFGVNRADGLQGDWDTGVGVFMDGPWAGKVDEGNYSYRYYDSYYKVWRYPIPYMGTWTFEPGRDKYFLPNRQVPSPLVLGSLPSRVIQGRPWETYAFCPNTAGQNHLGNEQSPKDHLLLDLFTMPVVAPYAITDSFSTAGRVNLNYQIMPFTNIHRSTALRAVLQSSRVTAVPTEDLNTFKTGVSGKKLTRNFRHRIDRDETLFAMDAFFDRSRQSKNDGFFKSATQICEVWLYPSLGKTFGEGVSPKARRGSGDPNAEVKNFWWGANKVSFGAATGDNMREKPYSDIYPRITTKSNSFTIHYRVQTLSQFTRSSRGTARADDDAYLQWDEDRDSVVGELRGSTSIERYLDQEHRRFRRLHAETRKRGDYVDPDLESLEPLHRIRVVESRDFSPW
jgi:uncharacterized protein (TIGR02600 family)